MPIKLIKFNEAPLVHGFKIEVINRSLLAKYVATLLLGYQNHIERIIQSQAIKNPSIPDKNIDKLIQKIREIETIKRDGWIFQMISWIAVRLASKEEIIHSQIPHSAPAQHGIDGISVILNKQGKIERIIITEDKATDNPRNVIQQQVFPEFKEYENGDHDSKLVNGITGFLKNISPDNLLEEIQNDIYRIDLRKYRIGITHDDSYNNSDGYSRLFKDYESAVLDADNNRRSADTFSNNNLRPWFDEFSELIIKELEKLKNV